MTRFRLHMQDHEIWTEPLRRELENLLLRVYQVWFLHILLKG